MDKLKTKKLFSHSGPTKGLDIFKDYLPNFDLYKSGKFRDNNKIRVGEYTPADYTDIKNKI